MHRFLLSSLMLLQLSAAALAADLPMRGSIDPAEPEQTVTWTGFYAGVNAGYGASDFRNRGIPLPIGSVAGSPATNDVIRIIGSSPNEGGFIGGGQVGYNHQFGAIVAGLEADAQYRDFGRRGPGTYRFTGLPGLLFPPAPSATYFRISDSEYFGTVRGRLGYAFDRLLVFATGGLAYDSTGFGWTAGGGAEYAFTQRMSLKVEALYVDLHQGRGVNPVFFPASRVLVLNDPHVGEFFVARAGLNVKFDTF